MKATYQKYILNFKNPSGTSRGVLNTKETWFIKIENQSKWGIGECGILRGLSIDDRPDYEEKLKWLCDNIHLGVEALYSKLTEFPSIQIGLETAFFSLKAKDPFQVFPSSFTEGKNAIPINGLIWMGDAVFMKQQISEKLKEGFTCLKMKIGAIDFLTELDLLSSIRKEFSVSEIELRVDANGAFQPQEALEKLKRLSDYQLHSVEQPIAEKQWEEMASLCAQSPVPIALDEELIGVFSTSEKEQLLKTIQPQYIILKPSFIGGFKGTDDWIEKTKNHNIKWWITSALESNVGLNAISQYTFTKNSTLPQGLGTGSLFTNNFPSALQVTNGSLHYNTSQNWDINLLNF